MIRKLLAIAILLLPLSCAYQPAMAQNTTCATRPPGDNSNACASTAFVQGALPIVPSSANPSASVGNTVVNGTATTYMRSDAAPPLGTGVAAANVGTLGGVLGGTLPNPSMAAGAAATNIGTLGGDLSGTLPNPTVTAVQGLAYQNTTYSNGQVPVWNTINNRFQPGSSGGFGSTAVQIISSCNGTGDDAAFSAAIAALPASGGEVLVTAATACKITSSATLNWSNKRVVISGVGKGSEAVTTSGTVISCAANLGAACVTMQNGAAGGGGGSGLRDLTLLGNAVANTAGTGVLLQCHGCFLQNVAIQNFGGACVYILSGVAAPDITINSNNWFVNNVSCTGDYGGSASTAEFVVEGQDSNAGTAVNLVVNSTQAVRVSIRDASFLGNTWIGPSCTGVTETLTCFMVDGMPAESAGSTYKSHGTVIKGLYVESGPQFGIDLTSGVSYGVNATFLQPNGSTLFFNDNTTNKANVAWWAIATHYCQYLNGTKSPTGC